jgi:hypothetical protein
MSKGRGAAYSEGSAPFADSAASVFEHLGVVSERLLQLQAQAASVALMDSAARYADTLDEFLRNTGSFGWMRMYRSQLQTLGGSMAAWVEAASSLQALLVAANMQALAMLVLTRPALAMEDPSPERRTDSVVIQFPDRRRSAH